MAAMAAFLGATRFRLLKQIWGEHMARVIVILSLMIAITAAMFAITRKTTVVASGEAASGPSTTMNLSEPGKAPAPAESIPDNQPTYDDAEQSLTSAEPRPVTNVIGAPTTAQDVTKGPVAGAAPSIGTAGIDHRGKASFTGTATPGETVALVWDGKTIGETKADASGNWSYEFKAPVAAVEHELYVSAKTKDGAVVIGPQRATVRPATADGSLARITLKTPDQTQPPPPPATDAAPVPTPAPEPKTGLIVEKITNGAPGSAVMTGRADPGATVKAAINGEDVGETRVAQDGTFTLTAPNKSGKDAKHVRLQLVDAKGVKLDETELPFEVAAAPAPTVVAAAEPTTKPEPAKPEPAKVETAKLEPPATLTSEPAKDAKPAKPTEDLAMLFKEDKPKAEPPHRDRKIIRVRRGDSLWRISRRHLGNGKKWAQFYRLNKRKIDNPDLIYPGQTLIIPG